MVHKFMKSHIDSPPRFWVLSTAILISFLGFQFSLKAQTKIVAAENFYGGVALEIAPEAEVTSILSNPNQDPHEFQADAATAAAVAGADIVIYSGIGYDDWMERLIATGGKDSRVLINVSELIGAKSGDNPHIWYDLKTMPALVAKLAEVLNLPDAVESFGKTMEPLTKKIQDLTPRTRALKVTATEPVFGYMATALGMDMLNYEYQMAVMNDTEPSFQQVADFENSLKTGEVKVLFYNNQVTDPSTLQLRQLAARHGIPVVGVSETQPPDAASYVSWMLSQLEALEKVLPE
jgi:zinc/manganese transport system substrate-binding protein